MKITIRPFLKQELTRKQIFLLGLCVCFCNEHERYVADLGINDDMDPGVFVIAWKLGCATPWVLSKTEWMNGWSQQGASSVAEMKSKLAGWRKDLEDNKVDQVELISIEMLIQTNRRSPCFTIGSLITCEATSVFWTGNRQRSVVLFVCLCVVFFIVGCKRFFGKLSCRIANGPCSVSGSRSWKRQKPKPSIRICGP
jgi:hypothetical protein